MQFRTLIYLFGRSRAASTPLQISLLVAQFVQHPGRRCQRDDTTTSVVESRGSLPLSQIACVHTAGDDANQPGPKQRVRMAGRGRGSALTVPAWVKDAKSGAVAIAASQAKPGVDVGQGMAVGPWAKALAPNGKPYWYNRATKETTWTDPTRPASLASRSEDTKKRASKWAKHQTRDGKTYYYDKVTRETRWTKPEDFFDPDADGRNLRESVDSESKTTSVPNKPSGTTVPEVRPAVAPSSTGAPSGSRSVSTGQEEPSTQDESRALPLPPGWKVYKTPDGRPYYHNKAQGTTSWTRPSVGPPAKGDGSSLPASSPGLSKNPEALAQPSTHATNSRPDTVPPVSDLRAQLTAPPNVTDSARRPPAREKRPSEAPLAPTRPAKFRRRTRAPPKGSVARPRTKEGKYMADPQAEAYFLARAQRERDRLAEVDRKARLGAGRGDRGIVNSRAQKRDAEGKGRVSDGVRKRRPQIEVSRDARERFELVLQDSNVSAKSSWLEAMGRSTPDVRYAQDIDMHGHRKQVYSNFVAKAARRARRANAIARLDAEDAFNKMLTEKLGDSETRDCRGLRDLAQGVRASLESDPRFKAVTDRDQRELLVRFFLEDIARAASERKERRRKDAIRSLKTWLESVTDWRLRAPRDATSEANAQQEKTNAKDAASAPDGGWLTEKTSTSDVIRRMNAHCAEDLAVLDRHDHEAIVHRWQGEVRRAAERLEEEKRRRARIEASTIEKEFVDGVETMLLNGSISFRAHWAEVSQTVMREEFGQRASTANVHVRPPEELYKKAARLFYGRVDERSNAFKEALRIAPADFQLTESTSLADLKDMECFKAVVRDVPDAVIAALAFERREKDARRRKRALADLENLLHRHQDLVIGKSWDEARSVMRERTAWKQAEALLDLPAFKTAYKEIADDIEHRRSQPGGDGPRSSAGALASTDTHKSLAPSTARPGEPALKKAKIGTLTTAPEDSGWAAAVSSKPLSDAERAEERARKKRELIAQLEHGDK